MALAEILMLGRAPAIVGERWSSLKESGLRSQSAFLIGRLASNGDVNYIDTSDTSYNHTSDCGESRVSHFLSEVGLTAQDADKITKLYSGGPFINDTNILYCFLPRNLVHSWAVWQSATGIA